MEYLVFLVRPLGDDHRLQILALLHLGFDLLHNFAEVGLVLETELARHF